MRLENFIKLAHRKSWFLRRIGERVFRNDTFCCKHCNDIYQNGIIIHDEMHADYLICTEAEYNFEGFPLKYFDTKQEVDFFESIPEINLAIEYQKKKSELFWKREKEKDFHKILKQILVG